VSGVACIRVSLRGGGCGRGVVRCSSCACERGGRHRRVLVGRRVSASGVSGAAMPLVCGALRGRLERHTGGSQRRSIIVRAQRSAHTQARLLSASRATRGERRGNDGEWNLSRPRRVTGATAKLSRGLSVGAAAASAACVEAERERSAALWAKARLERPCSPRR